jgi:hypothetical protein
MIVEAGPGSDSESDMCYESGTESDMCYDARITKMESRKTTKKQIGMKQTPTTKPSSGEGDLTQLWLIGPTRSCSYWNSSVRRIKDEITENGTA